MQYYYPERFHYTKYIPGAIASRVKPDSQFARGRVCTGGGIAGGNEGGVEGWGM